MIKSKDKLRKWIYGMLQTPDRRDIATFTEQEVSLPPIPEHGPNAGPVSFANYAYIKAILKIISRPDVRDVVIIGPTRILKTYILIYVLAYSIKVVRSAIIFIDQTRDKAHKLVKKEIIPFIDYNNFLADLKPDNTDNFTNSLMLMKGARVTFYGAQDAKSIQGDTAQIVLGNEFNKWKVDNGDESDVVSAARARTKTFDAINNSKRIFTGTPTLIGGVGAVEYLNANQMISQMRCIVKECNHRQHFEFKDIVWGVKAGGADVHKADKTYDLDLVRDTARLKCQKCGHLHTQKEWEEIAELIEFEPTASGKKGHVSILATAECSPKIRSLGDLSTGFLSALQSRSISAVKNWWNLDWGLWFVEHVNEINADQLKSLCQKYSRREVVKDIDMIMIGVDVQSLELPYVVRGYSWEGRSYLLDHGRAATWERIKKIQNAYDANFVIIDSGYNDRKVELFETIFAMGPTWLAARGNSDQQMTGFIDPQWVDPFLGKKVSKQHRKICVMQINTDLIKLEIEKRLKNNDDNYKDWFLYEPTPAEDLKELHSFNDYCTELLDERRIIKPGSTEPVWESKDGNNHSFDCEVYLFALFRHLQADHNIKVKR